MLHLFIVDEKPPSRLRQPAAFASPAGSPTPTSAASAILAHWTARPPFHGVRRQQESFSVMDPTVAVRTNGFESLFHAVRKDGQNAFFRSHPAFQRYLPKASRTLPGRPCHIP